METRRGDSDFDSRRKLTLKMLQKSGLFDRLVMALVDLGSVPGIRRCDKHGAMQRARRGSAQLVSSGMSVGATDLVTPWSSPIILAGKRKAVHGRLRGSNFVLSRFCGLGRSGAATAFSSYGTGMRPRCQRRHRGIGLDLAIALRLGM